MPSSSRAPKSKNGAKVASIVRECNPLLDPRWPQFVAQHPRASVFHTVPWLTALHQTYGYSPVVFTTSAPGEPLRDGVVACRVNSWITGRRLVSLPFSDHCEPLVDPEDLDAILTAMQRELQQSRLRYLDIRPVNAIETQIALFHSTYSYCSHELDLRPDVQTLFLNCHKSSTQRKILRAERENLVCEEGRSEALFQHFYRLLVITRRRHGIPPQPQSWFRNLIQGFGNDLKIRVAYQHATPIAAILTLRSGDVLTYKYGCSDARFNNLGGMHLLFWKAIQDGKREGARSFDLGRSEIENTGLITFKDRWGSRQSTLTYSRFTAAEVPKDGNATASGLPRVAHRLISVLPDVVLRSAGRVLYKHIG